jgi:hypothetical protein
MRVPVDDLYLHIMLGYVYEQKVCVANKKVFVTLMRFINDLKYNETSFSMLSRIHESLRCLDLNIFVPTIGSQN